MPKPCLWKGPNTPCPLSFRFVDFLVSFIRFSRVALYPGFLLSSVVEALPTLSPAMSIQLHISSSKERRPTNYRGNTRRLLRLSDIPDSPTSSGAVCEAVESDGRACWIALPSNTSDIWCPRHHDEWTQMTMRWGKVHMEAEKTMVTTLDVAKQKIMKLRQSVDLRRQIQDRFYPRGGDIQDYIKWINKMENDVRQLADSLLSKSSLVLHVRST